MTLLLSEKVAWTEALRNADEAVRRCPGNLHTLSGRVCAMGMLGEVRSVDWAPYHARAGSADAVYTEMLASVRAGVPHRQRQVIERMNDARRHDPGLFGLRFVHPWSEIADWIDRCVPAVDDITPSLPDPQPGSDRDTDPAGGVATPPGERTSPAFPGGTLSSSALATVVAGGDDGRAATEDRSPGSKRSGPGERHLVGAAS